MGNRPVGYCLAQPERYFQSLDDVNTENYKYIVKMLWRMSVFWEKGCGGEELTSYLSP